ncbi:MAG: HU family DNA-binding protein [Prevotellaceae bacterium]|nr:HU family DNA-binding protein [Prevotellaceae bacterium]
MNKTQLIAAVAEKSGTTKAEAARYVETVLGIIADNICEGDGDVTIPDFGHFYVKEVPARQGINPATKEKITIEAHDKIVFKCSDNLSIYTRKHPAK